MSQAENIGNIVVGLAALVAIVSPLLKLNTNIVKLNETMQNMIKRDAERDKRLDKHGEAIDHLNITVEKHQVRLHEVERRLDNHE